MSESSESLTPASPSRSPAPQEADPGASAPPASRGSQPRAARGPDGTARTSTASAPGGQSWHDALTREPLVLSLREGPARVVDLLSTILDALRKRALDLTLVGVLGSAGPGWATARTLPQTAQLPSPAFVVLQTGPCRGCFQLAHSLIGGPILRAIPGQVAAAPFGHASPPPPPPRPPTPTGPGPTTANLAPRAATPPPPPRPAFPRTARDRRGLWPELHRCGLSVDPPHALIGRRIPPPTPEQYPGEHIACPTVRRCLDCKLTFAVSWDFPHMQCLRCGQSTSPGHLPPPSRVPMDAMSLCSHCPDCLILWPMGTVPSSQRCSFCPTQAALVPGPPGNATSLKRLHTAAAGWMTCNAHRGLLWCGAPSLGCPRCHDSRSVLLGRPPLSRGPHPSCTPLEAVLIDAGLIPAARDRFGRSTPHRLSRGLAAGRGRFGLHNGRIAPAEIPDGWFLSRALAERHLADPLVNPARRSFDVLLGPVPEDTGRFEGVPNPRLAVAYIGPWSEGEFRRPAVREMTEHSLFTIHATVSPYLQRVDDRLEDRTLWFCSLCREEATPAHCCGRKHRNALAARSKVGDLLLEEVDADWDPGFDAHGQVSSARGFQDLRRRALAYSPDLAELLPTSSRSLPPAFPPRGKQAAWRQDRRPAGPRQDPGTGPSKLPPAVAFRDGDVAVSDLLRGDQHNFGVHTARLIWTEATSTRGPLPRDPKHASWRAKASHVLQQCSFLDPYGPDVPAALTGLTPKTPAGYGKQWVWLIWRQGRLPRRQDPASKPWFDISFSHPSWDWVDSVEAEAISRSAILVRVREDTVRLLTEGCPPDDVVEQCLASDRRLTPSPDTQRAWASPPGSRFEFRLDACIDWVSHKRDDGIVNFWYNHNVPPEHRVGQVISPMAAIISVPGLSAACLQTLNDVRHHTQTRSSYCPHCMTTISTADLRWGPACGCGFHRRCVDTLRQEAKGETWACPGCSALAPTAVESRLPRAPALRSALSLIIETISRHELRAPLLEDDLSEAEARERADVLVAGYLGVADVGGHTDLTLRSAYQAGIRGPALVEFCLEVAWRSSRPDRNRPPQCSVPASHEDTWEALLEAAGSSHVTDTVVRSRAPLRYAAPLDIHRSIANLNPQQATAVLLSHLNLVALIQGPPGTGKTTTLAHLVASHLGTLLPGAYIIVCAHTHAAVDVAFSTCLDVFRRLQVTTNVSRFGDPMSCFRQNTGLRSKHCASTRLGVEGFRPLGRRKRAHLDSVRRLAGTEYQVVFCTNSYVTHLYDPLQQHFGQVALVVSDESSQATRWSTLGAAAAVRDSGRLVLVGDQDQLGPVYASDTSNNAAARTLMDELFSRLPEEAKVTLTVQYRSHPTVMAFAKEHIYPNLWSAPQRVHRQLPEGIEWPTQLLDERDRRVCPAGAPTSASEWRLSPDTWRHTPLPPDMVSSGGPTGTSAHLVASASQDYLALAIDEAAMAIEDAPPRPGPPNPRPESTSDRPPSSVQPVTTTAAVPELPDQDEVDWGGDVVDPRPAGSTAPLAREWTAHPLVFIHVDGTESYGPHGHGLQNVAERQAILAVLSHCAGLWAKQDLSVLVICMYAEQHTALKKDIAALSEDLKRRQHAPASATLLQRVEVRTVDASQGHEADVVLLSFVRASKGGRLGFVNDRRRVNVALSRAKCGALLFGNVDTCVRMHDGLVHHLLSDLATTGAVRRLGPVPQSLTDDLCLPPYAQQNALCIARAKDDGATRHRMSRPAEPRSGQWERWAKSAGTNDRRLLQGLVDQLRGHLRQLFASPAFAVALCVVAGTKTQFFALGSQPASLFERCRKTASHAGETAPISASCDPGNFPYTLAWYAMVTEVGLPIVEAGAERDAPRPIGTRRSSSGDCAGTWGRLWSAALTRSLAPPSTPASLARMGPGTTSSLPLGATGPPRTRRPGT